MSFREDVSVVIVGAGFGGILAALGLKNKLGFSNFKIYEKGLEVGGTWRENTYPGCGCDVPSHWYSISSQQNPNWSQTFSSQPEIHQYMKDVVDKNDLRRHIEFGCKLTSGEWDPIAQHYKVSLTRTRPDGTKSEEVIYANVFISAIGGLHVPKLPDIKGIETFEGDMFHSAEWRHDISLENKTVGIIGNGCSSCQIVPVISKDKTTNVVNFCRTPAWFAPRDQTQYGAFTKWLFKNVPGVQRFFRSTIFVKSDLQYMAWKRDSTVIRKITEMMMRYYIKSKAPKHLLPQLLPQYPFGCKRVIRDPGYLSSLHRPNVKLEWDPIVEIVKDGIITKSGTHHKLDILVPATGFDTTSTVAPPIRGVNGVSVEEYFVAQGGPTAYRGTTIPGFPNVFVVLGPNVASGHASAIFVEEVQVDYIMKLLKPMLKKGSTIQQIEVDAAASEKFNEKLQKDIGGTVWTGCLSYYNQQGGKNVAMYPGFVTTFWSTMRTPKWKDYTIVKGGDSSVPVKA